MLDDIEMSSAAREAWEQLSFDDKTLLRIAFAQAIDRPELATRRPPIELVFGDGVAKIHNIQIGLCGFLIGEVPCGNVGLIRFYFIPDQERIAAE